MPNDFFEKDLEDIIVENKEQVVSRGFPPLLRHTLRQFRLPSRKVIDLLSFEINDNSLEVKVFELKKEELGISSLFQVTEYGQELARLTVFEFNRVNIELYLVGRSISRDLFNLSLWGLNVGMVEYSYNIDGILFDNMINQLKAPYWLTMPTELITPNPALDRDFSNMLRCMGPE